LIDIDPCRDASASTTVFFPGGSGRQRIIVLIVAVCMPEAVAPLSAIAIPGGSMSVLRPGGLPAGAATPLAGARS